MRQIYLRDVPTYASSLGGDGGSSTGVHAQTKPAPESNSAVSSR